MANVQQSIHFTTKIVSENTKTLARLARHEQIVPYIGLVGYGNLGDEILFKAHKTLFPEFSLEPFRIDTAILEKVAKRLNMPFCSYSILGGGTLINDGRVWIAKVEQLQRSKSKMFCIGTGVAIPAGHELSGATVSSRWLRALSKFRFIGVRGPLSHQTLVQSGIKEAQITGDSALCLARSEAPRHRRTGVIGINYANLTDDKSNISNQTHRINVASIIQYLLAVGFKVRLLPIWQRDVSGCSDLARDLNNSDCEVVEAYSSLDAYSAQVSECDYFIGQKLHSVVIATMNRVPSIMIEYRSKCRDYMASIQMDPYVIKLDQLDLKVFKSSFEEIERNYESVLKEINSSVLRYKNIQLHYAFRIKEAITP